MFTEKQARDLTDRWIEAWNRHDLDAIISHYDDDIVLISPVALKVLNMPSGMVKGKDALRAYFAKGLEIYPDLKFELLDMLWGVNSLILYYRNQKGVKAGEFMEVNPEGKVIKVVANYNI
ncbi:MAG: nuclear transport factor 2 family protein [Candidatus Omnitrophota bacterium]|jgi:hypothetical protein|nr:nuclear transport factor 2 family protein [Candidatus Omnitrophota bacterium]